MPQSLQLLVAFAATLLLVSVLGTSRVTAAPVDIYAGDFIDLWSKPLAGYTVLFEENGTSYTLDSRGRLSLDIPVGTNVTFTVVGDSKYLETQSATSTVPPQGLTGQMGEIILQVPDMITFDLLNIVVPHKHNLSQCQIVVTVCNYMKSANDCPQGFPGVRTFLNPPNNQDIFFFGTWGSLSNSTNPLPNKLTSTSWDGGVLFSNIPFYPGQEFTVSAQYGNVPFTNTRLKCLRAGKRLINGAPNQGPRAQAPLTSLPCPNTC